MAKRKKVIYFSNFKTSGKLADAVSIAASTPRWFQGPKLKSLAPDMATVRRYKKNPAGQLDWYMQDYLVMIYNLNDLDTIAADYVGKVLLCYCDKTAFCHRQLLAKTLEIEFGYECKEIGGWEIPFDKPFEDPTSFMSLTVPFEGEEVDIVGNYAKFRDERLKYQS